MTKEDRKIRNHRRLMLMFALLETAIEAGNCECKTIGNLNPEGKHCLTCSFNDISKHVKGHVDFWLEDGRYERAPS